MRIVVIAFVIALGLLAASLAMPVKEWRTGEIALPPLSYRPPAHLPAFAQRFWIDTDAACGTGEQRDPDDCLALWSLLRRFDGKVVGISTVFGNAPLDTTDAVTRELVDAQGRNAGERVPVYRGCAAPIQDRGCADPERASKAELALSEALRAGQMTVVALGPLTNLAAVLQRDPALVSRVSRLIAVMGRRPGHRFHPTENKSNQAMLLGHGPVFRDLNFVLDEEAAKTIVRAGIPLTLIPYDLARRVLMTEGDLDRLAATDPAGTWVAERSRDWLEFWRRDIGIDGFYPFDLMAAEYAGEPSRFKCAEVGVWIGSDPLFTWFNQAPALLVTQEQAPPGNATASGKALYCDDLREPHGFDPTRLGARLPVDPLRLSK